MLTDIEIAQAATPCPITEIAEKAGISEEYLECYGKTKAKVDYNLLRNEDHKPGKLVLVTAINPTAAGEGKTTTTVGLGDALSRGAAQRSPETPGPFPDEKGEIA